MKIIFFLLFSFVVLKIIKGFLQFHISWLWFTKKNRDLHIPDNAQESSKIIILIPVLREQNIIHKTLERFSPLKKIEKIIFITTEKENLENNENNETTFDILKREKEKYSNIDIIHYPYTTGVVAHQLNYACQSLEDKNYNGFVLIYNADSVIFQNSIDGFQDYIYRHPSANVIQQSAIFTDNYTYYPDTFRGDILKAIALYQSRWTFAHELYRLRNQLEDKNKWFGECGHVVGHGLCIRLRTLAEIGYFPSNVPNEDMSLGFYLKLKGEKIHILPILEIGESPRTIKAVIAQYTSWFYGVIYYPTYFKIALKKFPKKKMKAFFWSTLNTGRALTWLLTTYFWLTLFVISLSIGWVLLISTILLFTVYSIGNNYLIFTRLKKLNSINLGNEMTVKKTISLAAASLLVYLLQSTGPTIAAKNIIASKLLKSSLKKDKTER